MTKNMDTSVFWLIRNARGLTSDEKVLLFVIASRGVLKTARQTTEGDTGLSKNRLYKARNNLVERGIVQEHRGKFNPVSNKRDQTYLVINELELKVLPTAADDSHSRNKDSYSRNKDSHSGNKDSHSGDIKVTEKETVKMTDKVTRPEVLFDLDCKIKYYNLLVPLLEEYSNMTSSSLSLSSSALSTNSVPLDEDSHIRNRTGSVLRTDVVRTTDNGVSDRYRYQWERDTRDGSTALDLHDYIERKRAGQGVGKYPW